MKFPQFVYSVTFWEGVSWFVAGALSLLSYFGVIPAEYAYTAVAIFAFVKGVLKMFGVNIESK